MKKNVYSLVLAEEVVKAIDRLAYHHNTSRSNLINQILAEKVALTTPQMYMQNIFEEIMELMEPYHNFKIQEQASDMMCSICSVLQYKYNPTIRYVVTLDRKNGVRLGTLKMVSRTQSNVLKAYLDEFFKLWSRLEQVTGSRGWEKEDDTKWYRVLEANPKEYSNVELISEAIFGYIKAIDDGLQIFFSYLEDPAFIPEKLQEHFYYYTQNAPTRL